MIGKDADKTTATEDVMPVPDILVNPCTIASKNAYGGWNGKDLPQGETKAPGPGKHLSGNR